MKIVVSVGILVVHRCLYLVSNNSQFDIQRKQFQFTDCRRELESWVEVRYIIDLLLQIVVTGLRASNNVINVTLVQLWDEASITRVNLLLNISHVQTSVIRTHLAPHGHATNLAIVFLIARKGV